MSRKTKGGHLAFITSKELECATSVSCASIAAATIIFTGCQGIIPYFRIPGVIFLGAAVMGIAIFIALTLGTVLRRLMPRAIRRIHVERLRVLIAPLVSPNDDDFGTLISICGYGVITGFVFGGLAALLHDGDLGTRIGYGALVWAVTPELMVVFYLIVHPIANALHAWWRQ